MTTEYAEFLDAKTQLDGATGFDPGWMPDFLFPFQRFLVEWAVRKGRAAIFADCGLGKTPMQLVWAENVGERTGKPVLIVTPLAVALQTEGRRISSASRRSYSKDGKAAAGDHRHQLRAAAPVRPRRLRGHGVRRVAARSRASTACAGQLVTDFMRKMEYRLLATATAAPNDYIELGTSSEALGYLGHMDMLGRFFVNDQTTASARSGTEADHAARAAIRRREGDGGSRATPRSRSGAGSRRGRGPCASRPTSGYADDGFILPPLEHRLHVVAGQHPAGGHAVRPPGRWAWPRNATSSGERIHERCEAVAALVAHDQPAVAWCHLNPEGDLLDRS